METFDSCTYVNKGSTSYGNTLPDELVIDGEYFTDSRTIAIKFNEYFTSIAQILDDASSDTNVLNITKLQSFVYDKVSDNIHLAFPL